MNKIEKDLLLSIADLHSIPEGAYNIRKNGEPLSKRSTHEISIVPKKNNNGINIYVAPNTKNKSVHIPVIITAGGITDVVKNDFFIGENAEVLIVAGCGIHNTSGNKSEHNGIHTFHLEKNAKVTYVERHLGVGSENSEKVLNPVTKIIAKENSFLSMETVQLGGVSHSVRKTTANLSDNAKLVITEKILTTKNQVAKTNFHISLNGKNSSVEVVSRSVAKNCSKQEFYSHIVGNNECFGHVECDGIIVDNASIVSVPKIVAAHVSASLIHEAAIGKIAGEQIVKLQTLGLTEKEAEDLIIKGFLS